MFCVNCGREIDDDELFCPFCGVRIQQKRNIEQYEAQEPPQRYSKSSKSSTFSKPVIIAIVVAAVVVAGAIAAFALLSGSKEDPEIADVTPPEISVKQTTINEGAEFYIRDFVSVEDDVDGPINEQDITVEGTVDTSVPGTYNITVSASDLAGNKATRDLTVEVIKQQGSQAAFIKKITGLWLNGCQSAAIAKETAHNLGMTDVSMTEFVASGNQCMMSTLGDITGEYDGDTVPAVTNGLIEFTYISPDECKAEGTVNGMDISFDLGSPNDQVIMYSCGGYYTHCAYTGFSTEREMYNYLDY